MALSLKIYRAYCQTHSQMKKFGSAVLSVCRCRQNLEKTLVVNLSTGSQNSPPCPLAYNHKGDNICDTPIQKNLPAMRAIIDVNTTTRGRDASTAKCNTYIHTHECTTHEHGYAQQHSLTTIPTSALTVTQLITLLEVWSPGYHLLVPIRLCRSSLLWRSPPEPPRVVSPHPAARHGYITQLTHLMQ